MNTVSEYRPASSFAADHPLPDLRKKQALLTYFWDHERHADHNDPFYFSNVVKLHSLNIPFALRDQAYDVLSYELDTGNSPDEYNLLFDEFAALHDGIEVGFAGRSGGHIVMIESLARLSPAELAELSMKELRDLARLVHAFDLLCDSCVSAFMSLVTDYEIVTKEIQVTRSIRVLEPKE